MLQSDPPDLTVAVLTKENEGTKSAAAVSPLPESESEFDAPSLDDVHPDWKALSMSMRFRIVVFMIAWTPKKKVGPEGSERSWGRLRSGWVQHCCIKVGDQPQTSCSLWSTFSQLEAVLLVVLELALIIRNRFPGLFDESKLELLEVLRAEAQALRLGLAFHGLAAIWKRRPSPLFWGRGDTMPMIRCVWRNWCARSSWLLLCCSHNFAFLHLMNLSARTVKT